LRELRPGEERGDAVFLGLAQEGISSALVQKRREAVKAFALTASRGVSSKWFCRVRCLAAKKVSCSREKFSKEAVYRGKS